MTQKVYEVDCPGVGHAAIWVVMSFGNTSNVMRHHCKNNILFIHKEIELKLVIEELQRRK
ncbi:hypothetical protein PAJ34TS1_54100 [Paenibacillus azoreducens]|uniref:Uncharacterized protein n=1 Tax=Paenibacillus azoreducens TaxID=116718 RepID=A0A919YKW1_9BACL|nr:hypothetical protein J34TS1_61480 [Paenibacillus azoreducens]